MSLSPVPPVVLASARPQPAGEALAERLGSAAPAIARRVLRARLRYDDELEDLVSRTVVKLLARVRASGPDGPAIGDLEAYVAVTAYRVYAEHLRHTYPDRHRRKGMLRRLFLSDERFALWRDATAWRCGLAEWRAAEALPTVQPPTPGEEQGRAFAVALDVLGRSRAEGRELLFAAFAAWGRPLSLNELLAHAAPEREAAAASRASAAVRDPAAQLDDRIFLGQLWAEARRLPAGQRVALLLNLRDGHGRDALALLPMTGTASMREIAAALELPAEQLATLWKDLPLDDQAIAGRLGLTRQQVINLRSSARKRLARRLLV